MDAWKPENVFHKKTDGVYNGMLFVQKALGDMSQFGKRVVTSRDPGMREIQESLRRPNMPKGIIKWQLPIVISDERPSFVFITFVEPNAHVPMHIHPDDAITRIIMSGSVTIERENESDSKIEAVELTHGDWVYVPNTVPYAYTAGPIGTTMFHIYNCAGGDDNPARSHWRIHGFPGGKLNTLEGLSKSDIPSDWL